MAMSKEDIIKEIEAMTVVELNDLVEALKEKFGVTAPVAVAGAAAGGGEAAAEEKTDFNVVLDSAGQNKIAVIKEVKAILGLGLKEAKAFVDNPGKPLKEGVDKAEADEIKEKLEAAGATVELK
ncbi:MAG TPA: 50S ribosomal protein L7/L12 [Spirochaetota bacterium]|nr:50S ribosomal protein L7/L12 [Spirochaetota bacterium]